MVAGEHLLQYECQGRRWLTKEDRVRIFFSDLQRLDELLEVVHRKALEGDPAAVHAEVKVLERRSRMVGLDAPRQLDMTLEVRTQRSTADMLRASIERMVAQGKLSSETQERIRSFGFLPKADVRAAEDSLNPLSIDPS